MNDYDVTLKRILTRPGSGLLKALTGYSELRWLNVELPEVNSRRIDLLGEAPDGELIHIELQSTNEPDFADRMGSYLFLIKAQCGRYPRQIALYVGDRPLRMSGSIEIPKLCYSFDLLDIRDVDGIPLLESPDLSDNVIAVLTRLGTEKGTLRRIVRRIAETEGTERDNAFAELGILAGLRQLRNELKEEQRIMPITEDIMENEFIRPFIERGIAKGMEQGRSLGLSQGLSKGITEGRLEIVTGLLEERFGSVPPQLRTRLASMDLSQLKAVSLSLLRAERIEDLFPGPSQQ